LHIFITGRITRRRFWRFSPDTLCLYWHGGGRLRLAKFHPIGAGV